MPKHLFFILLILCAYASAAEQMPKQRQEISIGLHYSQPWAYLDDNKEIVGIERDIIERVFNQQGYVTKFYIYGYARLLREFNNRYIDFASPYTGVNNDVSQTVKYLPYQDIAISLKQRNLVINTVQDLESIKIVAYQHAKDILGPEFRQQINQPSLSYREIPYRASQLKMLFKQRIDVVIGEERILKTLSNKLYGEGLIRRHYIFKPQYYGGAAYQKKLITDFNRGLALLKKSDEYQRIYDKYKF